MSSVLHSVRSPLLIRDAVAQSESCYRVKGSKAIGSPSVTSPASRLGILCRRSRLLGGESSVKKISGACSSAKAMGTASSSPNVTSPVAQDVSSGEQVDYKKISDEDWQKRLTREQFQIARKKGTERAFTGEYWNTKTAGTYVCVCCETPLFDSKTKFDSGTGWPSYWQPVGNNVKSETDWSIPFMPRCISETEAGRKLDKVTLEFSTLQAAVGY
ncbi:hypothetical protein R1sor_000483 [Riccia sorocarpa]|uniref:peptide-methionine (R)-S-oxide reductase n=1 Tax=Riccia sorocarpa TaxID=122646 RepID=A0ABD3GUX9_9MARC